MNRFYQNGQFAAASTFGLEKSAFVSKVLPFARDILIGSPELRSRFFTQFRKGDLLKPGGVWREGLWPSDTFGKVLVGGTTAMGLHDALTAPKEERGSALGGLVGGTIGGAMGYPFGLIGGAPLSILGSLAGSSIGSTFNKQKSPYELG